MHCFCRQCRDVIVGVGFCAGQFGAVAGLGVRDFRKNKYVGIGTDSMASILWQYEGETDGDRLAVHTEGPHPALPGKIKFRNTWEFNTKDMLVLTSEMEGPVGKMVTIMKSTCRRKNQSSERAHRLP